VSEEGARTLALTGEKEHAYVGLARVHDGESSCCHPDGIDKQVFGGLWYRFTASSQQVTIQAESSEPETAIVQIYESADPPGSNPQCANLTPFACKFRDRYHYESTVFVDHLKVGFEYYVLVAAPRAERPLYFEIWAYSDSATANCGGCYSGALQWIDPPACVVDAGQPHALDDAAMRQGIRVLHALQPNRSPASCCWEVREVHPYPIPNENLTDYAVLNEDCSTTVYLRRPLAPGSFVELYDYSDEPNNDGSYLRFFALPGDVNGDGTTGYGDLLTLVDILNGVTQPKWGHYSCDIDRDGACAAPDLLRLIDLFNGAGSFEPWLGATLPSHSSDQCP